MRAARSAPRAGRKAAPSAPPKGFEWMKDVTQFREAHGVHDIVIDSGAVWKLDQYVKIVLDGLRENHPKAVALFNGSPLEMFLAVVRDIRRRESPEGRALRFVDNLISRLADDIRLRDLYRDKPDSPEGHAARTELRKRGLLKR